MKRKILRTIFIFTIIGLSVYSGYILNHVVNSHRVVMTESVKTEIVKVPVVVPVEVIREVTRDVERIILQREEVVVEVEVEVPKQLRDFESLDELRTWLDGQPNYVCVFPNCDCDDFARWLVEDAAEDGYRLSWELDYSRGKLHLLNSAIIGNGFYLIEPQGHKVWFKCLVD